MGQKRNVNKILHFKGGSHQINCYHGQMTIRLKLQMNHAASIFYFGYLVGFILI